MILITDQIITVEYLKEGLKPHPCCGALLIFEGIVRNENLEKPVHAIQYECYEGMAKKEFEKIILETKGQWKVHQVAVAHRTGKVAIGETSLIVIVTAPHRREAFDAIQYLIGQTKERVPIWKKEFYETGTANWLG